MPETDNRLPIDHEPSVRAHLDLDNAAPALRPDTVRVFDRNLLDAVHEGSAWRANMNKVHPRRAFKLGLGVVTAVALGTNPVVQEGVSAAIDVVRNESAAPNEVPQSDMSENPATETIIVQPGDTVWDIADARTEGDVRPVVDQIMEQPAAQDGLQPGEKLEVPVEG